MTLRTFASRLLGSAASFNSDRNGQVAVTLALTMIPVVSLLGAAIDLSSLIKAKTSLQAKVDAVALGAQQYSPAITTSAALQTYAARFLNVTSATYNSADGSMCITAGLTMPTNVLKIAQINTMTTSATACSLNASATSQTYEIALALDNTGSMSVSDSITSKTKIASEITAAKNFVTQMFTTVGTSNMQISVVPFTTAVNVGTGYSNATWMDTLGKSSIHWENFPKLGANATTYQQTAEGTMGSRFDLFTQINQSWAGCVEERPQPYTLTDDKPNSATPDTLYVPMFAPDESDSAGSGYKSYNSYLQDIGGTCGSNDAYDTLDNGTAVGTLTGKYKDNTTFWGDNQQKLCKYLVKYAANNPASSSTASTISSWLSANGSPGNNNWTINGSAYGNYQVPAATIANLIVSNNLYNVNSNNTTISFCTNFNVSYSNQNGYSISNNGNSCSSSTSNYSNYATYNSYGYSSYTGYYSASLPANYVNNPQGSSWSTSGSTITSTGWGASSSYSAWNGSGWGYGGSGWGTGSGWGWGGGSGNSSGFNSSTTNPGYNASGQSSSQYIGSSQFNVGGGANSGCDSTLQPLQTLTSTQATLNTLIGKMVANGATNLVSGFMWAWRTISPNGPFTASGSPRAYGTANNKKIIVFMTDGFNNWEPDDSRNGGVYSSLGYYHNNRAGALTVSGTSQTPTAANNRSYLDAAFLQACTNAKNAGIEVYTVAFSISNAPIDTQGKTVLQSCASDSSHYFLATDGTQLNTFFTSIGQSVTQNYLRLKS
jgi:Flp pilus assembly protein TadG